MIVIASLLPSLLNTNGDAENAGVLARRAEWAGIEARVVQVESAEDVPPDAGLVVIGSGTDTSLDNVVGRLRPLAPAIAGWLGAGTPVIAVGTGWEALSEAIETPDGALPGLGLVPGRAVRGERVVADIVVEHPELGRLVGFENHQRGYALGAASGLANVISGTGNADGARTDGMRFGSFIGTHLHGPVLAKNPALADALLRDACVSQELSYQPGEHTAVVDGHARRARNRVLASLDLPEQ